MPLNKVLKIRLLKCYVWAVLLSIYFGAGFIPASRSGQIYPTLKAISPTPTLNLARIIGKTYPSSSSSAPYTPLYLSYSYCLHSKSLPSPKLLIRLPIILETVLVQPKVRDCTFLFVVGKCGPPQPLGWLVPMFSCCHHHEDLMDAKAGL